MGVNSGVPGKGVMCYPEVQVLTFYITGHRTGIRDALPYSPTLIERLPLLPLPWGQAS
jgi:hypothetical protein